MKIKKSELEEGKTINIKELILGKKCNVNLRKLIREYEVSMFFYDMKIEETLFIGTLDECILSLIHI